MRDALRRASAPTFALAIPRWGVASGRAGVWVLIGASLLAACSSDDTVEGDPPPTEITVDPLEFLGDLPCSEDEGAAQAYVAAAVDVTDGSFTLAASPPAPCTTRVGFRHVVVGHAYTADVDVYDRPASELTPAGGPTSGSRVMLDPTGAVVAPRWRTRCGVGSAGPAIALDDASVLVSGCDPLDGAGSATTAVVVDPADALGGLACDEDDGGEVDAIRVVPVSVPDGSTLPTVTVDCGGEPVVFDEGVVPGATYRFRLEGLAAGDDDARWGATCVVVASDGVARRATCESLSSSGAIVASTAPLEDAGFACGVDFDTFDVILDGPERLTLPRTPCTHEVRLAPAPPGRYEGTLRTFESQGTSGDDLVERTALCEVDVAPGETAQLACSFK